MAFDRGSNSTKPKTENESKETAGASIRPEGHTWRDQVCDDVRILARNGYFDRHPPVVTDLGDLLNLLKDEPTSPQKKY